MKADLRLGYHILRNWVAYRWGLCRPLPVGYCILGITYRCNARCVMCDIHGSYRENPRLVDQELDLPLLRERLEASKLIRAIRHIDITGGEPFLREGLADFISGLFRIGRIRLATMNTNGFCTDAVIACTRSVMESITSDKVFSLSVSMDGIGAVHDTIRGREGAFSRVEATIAGLKQIRRRFPNFILRSNAVIQQGNIDSLAAIKDFWERNAIAGAYSVMQEPFYAGRDGGAAGACFSATDIRKIKAATPKSKGMDYYLDHGCKRPLPCFAGYAAMFIDPFGTVYPCNFLARNEAYAMGNITEDPLDSIWSCAAAGHVRAKVKKCPYTGCWNGCEAEQTLIQHGALEKAVRILSLGSLSYYRLRGLKGFK